MAGIPTLSMFVLEEAWKSRLVMRPLPQKSSLIPSPLSRFCGSGGSTGGGGSAIPAATSTKVIQTCPYILRREIKEGSKGLFKGSEQGKRHAAQCNRKMQRNQKRRVNLVSGGERQATVLQCNHQMPIQLKKSNKW